MFKLRSKSIVFTGVILAVTVVLGWAAEVTNVPFDLTGATLHKVTTTLVFGNDRLNANYRVHNDGPDTIDVKLMTLGEKPVAARHFALGKKQTVDLALYAQDLVVELPDGGHASGWYNTLK